MPTHKSISRRLKTAGTPALKLEIAHDWSQNWQREQSALIDLLCDAVDRIDHTALVNISNQLVAVTEKRFAAMPNVLNVIAGTKNHE